VCCGFVLLTFKVIVLPTPAAISAPNTEFIDEMMWDIQTTEMEGVQEGGGAVEHASIPYRNMQMMGRT
jgi:hypothetical protein